MKESDPTAARIQTNQDTRTVPDPSVLTTQQLDKGLAGLREILEARLDCMDDDLEHLREHIKEKGVSITAEVKHLRKLVVEKFAKMKLQFKLIEQQRIEQKSDTKAAVDAALTAQKEAAKDTTLASEKAINKNETATIKQIDLQADLFRTSVAATDKQVSDLKERVTTIEGRTSGHSDVWGYVIGGVGILAAIMAIIIHFAK